MAHNEYYTFEQGTINGQISMNVQVFDEITKKVVNEMEDVSLDTTKGFQVPGTKKVVSCSIKENEIYINIHIRLKYGVNVSKMTKEIQEKIAFTILELTGVEVKHINIEVDNIDFE